MNIPISGGNYTAGFPQQQQPQLQQMGGRPGAGANIPESWNQYFTQGTLPSGSSSSLQQPPSFQQQQQALPFQHSLQGANNAVDMKQMMSNTIANRQQMQQQQPPTFQSQQQQNLPYNPQQGFPASNGPSFQQAQAITNNRFAPNDVRFQQMQQQQQQLPQQQMAQQLGSEFGAQNQQQQQIQHQLQPSRGLEYDPLSSNNPGFSPPFSTASSQQQQPPFMAQHQQQLQQPSTQQLPQQQQNLMMNARGTVLRLSKRSLTVNLSVNGLYCQTCACIAPQLHISRLS